MNYYIFEVADLGRFAVEAPTYEDATKLIFTSGFGVNPHNDDWCFIGEATLEELDAEGLDVL